MNVANVVVTALMKALVTVMETLQTVLGSAVVLP
jgi:hypothetical protein